MELSLATALRYGPLVTLGGALLGGALGGTVVYALAARRRALRASAVMGSLVFLGVFLVSVARGERAQRELGAPRPRLVAIEGDRMQWTSQWSVTDLGRIRSIALSPPRWRALCERYASLKGYETPWPPMDSEGFESTRARLRLAGDCRHEVELYLRTGRLSEARSLSVGCDAAGPLGLEARWSEAPVAHCAWSSERALGCLRDGVLDPGTWRSDDPGAVRLSVWWNPLAARGESVSVGDDPLRCVAVASARIVEGAPGTSWDDLLAHPHPACRILAATRASRRDEASLRAMREASTRATGGFRPLLDLARTVTSLEGMSLGRVSSVPCEAQRVVGTVDPEYFRAHPELIDTALHAAAATRCAWVKDQLGYPAQEALSWREVISGEGRSLPLLVSARRERALGWAALHRDDRRFGPRAMRGFVAQELRIQAMVPQLALSSLDEDFAREGRWPGGFTWASVVDSALRSFPRGPRSCERGPGLTPRAPEGPSVFDPCTLRTDYRAAASMQRAELDASLVEFWRTGEWAPSREAPGLYHSPEMLRVVAASAGGRGTLVLAALGAPSARSVAMLAAVAYRVRSERESLEGFVRASMGFTPSLASPLALRFGLLDPALRAAQRLRLTELAGEIRRARSSVLRAQRGPVDPWLHAVLETLITEGRGP